jgi:hypothetical protein
MSKKSEDKNGGNKEDEEDRNWPKAGGRAPSLLLGFSSLLPRPLCHFSIFLQFPFQPSAAGAHFRVMGGGGGEEAAIKIKRKIEEKNEEDKEEAAFSIIIKGRIL